MSDVFVALPPATVDNCIIFGKNADRPPTEVQEVVLIKAAEHPIDAKVQTTFTEIEQVQHTHAVILSKAAWSWGAEMGANEKGVCVGSTAVWTKLCQPGDHEEKLIGADFVRLSLERGDTAKESLDVITELLKDYDQTGPCCEDANFSQWTYNNSFLIADRREAWVLETAGKHWTAKKITNGVRNISNILSIGTDMDLKSEGLEEFAKTNGFWDPDEGPFDFSKAFGAEYGGIVFSDSQHPSQRFANGKTLLEEQSGESKFGLESMLAILRNVDMSINISGELKTMASQVSVLSPVGSKTLCSHWLTATPDARLSVFKPFVFCNGAYVGKVTMSPALCPGKKAAFQSSADREHMLYKFHEGARETMQKGSMLGNKMIETMRRLEEYCIRDTRTYIEDFQVANTSEVRDLFKDVVMSEAKFYG